MEQYKTQEMFSRDELEGVAKGLEQDLDLNPVTRVYYDQFLREGLPILRTAHEDFNTKAWIEYAGHPFAAVEVYLPNGELKYSIPSMVDNLETPKGVFEERFTDHIQELLSLRADNPNLASISVYNALNRIVGDDAEAYIESGVKAIKAVNVVFRDQGIPELAIRDFEKRDESATETTAAPSAIANDHPIGDSFEEL